MFNLLNAVDNQCWDFGRCHWSEVRQGGLHTKYITFYVGNVKVIENNERLLSGNRSLSNETTVPRRC